MSDNDERALNEYADMLMAERDEAMAQVTRMRRALAELVREPFWMYSGAELTCWRCGNTEAEGHTARCAVGAGERALKGAM